MPRLPKSARQANGKTTQYTEGGQAPMKRITRKEIRAEWNKSWSKQDTSAELDREEMLVLEDILDAQLASCKKEQEQERRAIGERLERLKLEGMSPDKLFNSLSQCRLRILEGIEALKQGTLPEGMVK
jgi:hypothetical protein